MFFAKIIPVLAILALSACSAGAAAASITGTVRLDRDGDRWPGTDDPGIPAMLVSDGYGFTTTDSQGVYQLELNPKAQTVYVQRTTDYTADVAEFWHRITPERKRYDFLMSTGKPIGNALSLLMVGDPETDDLAYGNEMRRVIATHPEIDLVVIAGDISAGNPLGMEAHRNFVNARTLGRTTVYACGNHDVDFRGRGMYGQNCPFQALFGPWWHSFELGGYLFVTVPIYNSWGAPLAYDILDCGDWLQALCARYPDHKKILLAHDLPDLVGYTMATRQGKLNFDDAQFIAACYGHKHMNIVKKYPSGRRSFSVAPPNKGGAGSFAPCFRMVSITRENHQASSRIVNSSLREHLNLTSPCGNQWYRNDAGQLCLHAEAYDGGNDVMAVTAEIAGQAIALNKANDMGWTAAVECDLSSLPEATTVRLTASTADGTAIVRDFSFSPRQSSPIAWITQLPAEIAICDLTLINGLLVIGVADDANAEKGGIYALDPASGKILWYHQTGYGVRNTMATDGERIFAIDTRANIHAVNLAGGQAAWISTSEPTVVSPSASGVIYQDGVVVGGYGRHLRGIDATTGAVIWRNTAWQVEERTPAEDKLALTADGSVLVISRLNGLYRHDVKTGKVQWLYKTLFANATALPDGDHIWLLGSQNNVLKLSGDDGSLLSEIKPYPCRSATAAPVLLTNGLLLVASADRGLGAMNTGTGREVWRFSPGPALFPTGDYITGQPAAVTATPLPDGSAVWVAANDGCLYLLDAESGSLLRKYTVGLPILSRPCTDPTFIFVADCGGRVMSLRKTP